MGLMGLAVLGLGCKKDRYDKPQMLQDIVAEVILPAHEELVSAAGALEVEAAEFCQAPSAQGLAELRTALELTVKEWAGIELYNFGPTSDRYLHIAIYKGPTNVSSVENAIADTMVIDSIFMRGRSSVSKGLPCVEYLLFGEAGNAQIVLDSFSIGANAARRRAYLLEAVRDVRLKAGQINSIWQPTGENYAATFGAADGTGLQSGISLLSNALIGLCEEVVRVKLGKPLGKESADGRPVPSLVESPYANYSYLILKENLLSMEMAYKGGNGEGFDDYLRYLSDGEEIAAGIEAHFGALRTALEPLPSNNMATEVLQNTVFVEELYAESKALLIALNTDMAGLFNITITPNDNDGD